MNKNVKVAIFVVALLLLSWAWNSATARRYERKLTSKDVAYQEELSVAETKVFRNKKKAKKQFDDWLK